jgi:hypothetical protein
VSILGYSLAAHDNGGRFFPYDLSDCPDGVICKTCGTCLDYRYCPDEIPLDVSSRYHVGSTYDNRTMFSEAFIEHCRPLLRSGDYLRPIKAGQQRYYYLFPEQVTSFDSTRRETRFSEPCPQCGGHGSIVGAHPAFLCTNMPLELGFFRTDLGFGSKQEKFPLILVGEEGRSLIDRRKWRGLEWSEIRD